MRTSRAGARTERSIPTERFYLRDAESGAVWSAAFAPLNKTPDRYEVEFADDKAVYRRTDGEIDTRTEVFVTTDENAEIRKLMLKNNGETARTVEITSYAEIVLAPRAADLAHMAFSNLFVETDFYAPLKMVTAKRRPRSAQEKELWMGAFLVQNPEAAEEVEFEPTVCVLGPETAAARRISGSQPLSAPWRGARTDRSLRTRVMVLRGRRIRGSFVTIVAESGIIDYGSKELGYAAGC